MTFPTIEHGGRLWDAVASSDTHHDGLVEVVFTARGEPAEQYVSRVGTLAMDRITSGEKAWHEAMLVRLLDETMRDDPRPAGTALRAPSVRLTTPTRSALEVMLEAGVDALPVLAFDGRCAGVVLRAGIELGCVKMRHPEDCAVLNHLKRNVELVHEREVENLTDDRTERLRVVVTDDGLPAYVLRGGGDG